MTRFSRRTISVSSQAMAAGDIQAEVREALLGGGMRDDDDDDDESTAIGEEDDVFDEERGLMDGDRDGDYSIS